MFRRIHVNLYYKPEEKLSALKEKQQLRTNHLLFTDEQEKKLKRK